MPALTVALIAMCSLSFGKYPHFLGPERRAGIMRTLIRHRATAGRQACAPRSGPFKATPTCLRPVGYNDRRLLSGFIRGVDGSIQRCVDRYVGFTNNVGARRQLVDGTFGALDSSCVPALLHAAVQLLVVLVGRSMQLNACYVTGHFRLAFLPKSAYCNPLGDWLLFRNQSPMLDGVESTQIHNWLLMADNSAIDLRKLGQGIRSLRLGKGWSLSDLTETSGVSKAYISDLENGTAGKPNIQYVYAIAVALDVTLDELLGEAAPKPARKSTKKVSDLPRDCWS